MARYSKNYIREAVIRIDLLNPINELDDYISEDINIFLMKTFSDREQKDSYSDEIKLDALTGSVERKRIPRKEWNYFRHERKKRICLTKNFLFISFQEYSSYDDFSECFVALLKLFSEKYPDIQASRIGVRYVNNIVIVEDPGEPLEWSKYIKPELLSSFSLKPENSELVRTVQVLEHVFPKDDIRVKFQYGMHNPDYPAVIKKKLFLLDIDGYKKGALNWDDLIYLISEIHSNVEIYFEKSITETLREKMNE